MTQLQLRVCLCLDAFLPQHAGTAWLLGSEFHRSSPRWFAFQEFAVKMASGLLLRPRSTHARALLRRAGRAESSRLARAGSSTGRGPYFRMGILAPMPGQWPLKPAASRLCL